MSSPSLRCVLDAGCGISGPNFANHCLLAHFLKVNNQQIINFNILSKTGGPFINVFKCNAMTARRAFLQDLKFGLLSTYRQRYEHLSGF